MELVPALEEAAAKIGGWQKASTDVLALLSAGTLPAGSRVAALPFTASELQDTVKAAAALSKSARAEVAESEAQRAKADGEHGDETEKVAAEEKPTRRKRKKEAA